jgi:phenylacetate-CoA ligase
MDRFTDFRVKAPRLLKHLYRSACCFLPFSLRRAGSIHYWLAKRAVATWQYATKQKEQREWLRTANLCIAHAAYYKRLWSEKGLIRNNVLTCTELTRFPTCDRQTLIEHNRDLVVDTHRHKPHHWHTTGGTTGRPIQICVGTKALARDRAYWDLFLQSVDIPYTATFAVLQNDLLPPGTYSDFNRAKRRLRLDPFQLTAETAPEYLEAIAAAGTRFLHTYPSAAQALLRLAQQNGRRIDQLFDAILMTSENIYPGQREQIEEGYQAPAYAMYGHTERQVFAAECKARNGYHIYPGFGITELLDESGAVISTPNIRGEITGTGFNNPIMPLVRYRTGDSAEYAADACPCGSPWPRLINIEGRWRQEFLVRSDGSHVTLTALNLHSSAFNHVEQLQLVQKVPGMVTLQIVPDSHFHEEDNDAIMQALTQRLGPKLSLKIESVDAIGLTSRGKRPLLMQEIPLAASAQPIE